MSRRHLQLEIERIAIADCGLPSSAADRVQARIESELAHGIRAARWPVDTAQKNRIHVAVDATATAGERAVVASVVTSVLEALGASASSESGRE